MPKSAFGVLFSLAKDGLSTTSWHQAKEVNAQKASDAWLYMVDEGEYSESWQNASSYFKNAVDENQLEKDFFLPFMVMS